MIRTISLATLLLSTLVSPAVAGTIWSPHIGAGAICSVVNVGDRAREVSIEVYNPSGVFLSALGTTRNLQPGHAMSSSTSNSTSYCKITYAGSKKSLRMSARACGSTGCHGILRLE